MSSGITTLPAIGVDVGFFTAKFTTCLDLSPPVRHGAQCPEPQDAQSTDQIAKRLTGTQLT